MSSLFNFTLVCLLLSYWICVTAHQTEMTREIGEVEETTGNSPVKRTRLKRKALELTGVPEEKTESLEKKKTSVEPMDEGIRAPSRIKKQILFPVQWQYVLPGLNPGGSAPWLYYPVSTASPTGWLQPGHGTTTDQVTVDHLYGGVPSHRGDHDRRTDDELVNELYRKTTSTSESPCVLVPPGDISLSSRPCRSGESPRHEEDDSTNYRGSYWPNKALQGHYHTPQARLSSFGHVIIHDKNQ